MQTINKDQILKIFRQIYQIQEDVKDYNSTISDFKKVLAEELGVKTDIVTKVYSAWLISIEDPDKLANIDELFEAIR